MTEIAQETKEFSTIGEALKFLKEETEEVDFRLQQLRRHYQEIILQLVDALKALESVQ